MNLAEQLFFRYTPGDAQKYSTETLLPLANDVFRYGKVLAKHAEKFILFLCELPDHLFSYYNRIVGFDIAGALEMNGIYLKGIFEDPRILSRQQQLPGKDELHHELSGVLRASLHTTNVQTLDGHTFAISIAKNDAKYQHELDLLISCHHGHVHTYELHNEFKKVTKGQHSAYDQHHAALLAELQVFQEKNRLHLLYV